MPKEFSRTQRIAHEIQKELATILQHEIRNPRIGMVSITAVNLSPDLACAKVFVTFIDQGNDTERIKRGVKGLETAAGFIRLRLGQSMNLRVVPALHFLHDQASVDGFKMSNLLMQLSKQRALSSMTNNGSEE